MLLLSKNVTTNKQIQVYLRNMSQRFYTNATGTISKSTENIWTNGVDCMDINEIPIGQVDKNFDFLQSSADIEGIYVYTNLVLQGNIINIKLEAELELFNYQQRISFKPVFTKLVELKSLELKALQMIIRTNQPDNFYTMLSDCTVKN